MSWVDQNLYSRVLNDSSDYAGTTVSGRLFHGSVTLIRNTVFLRFGFSSFGEYF